MTPQHRGRIMITLVIGTLMAALDTSIVNISIPAMMRSFGVGVADIEKVVSVYMIGFAVVMPVIQWLKNRMGFFKLYFAAMAVFTLGSLLCGLATSLPFLVFARIIQAIGGGALTPTAMAIIATLYPASERGRVIGYWGLGVILGPAVGPALGGVLTEHFGWPSIFLVNIPIGIAGLWMTWRYIRSMTDGPASRRAFDFAGYAALSVVLVSLLLGIGALERIGSQGPGRAAVFLAVALTSLIAFLRIERSRSHPLIDLRLFRNRGFVACISVSFARTAALYGGVFLLPLLLQGLMGMSETASGALMFPGAALIAFLMPIAGKFSDRRGCRRITFAGLAIVTVSMLMFGSFGAESSQLTVLLVQCLRGVGLGLLITPLSVATVGSVPHEEIALATSISSLAQQVGGALGIAGLSVLHELFHAHAVAIGYAARSAEEFALQGSFVASGLIVALALFPAARIPDR